MQYFPTESCELESGATTSVAAVILAGTGSGIAAALLANAIDPAFQAACSEVDGLPALGQDC